MTSIRNHSRAGSPKNKALPGTMKIALRGRDEGEKSSILLHIAAHFSSEIKNSLRNSILLDLLISNSRGMSTVINAPQI